MKCDCDNPGLLPLEQALAKIHSTLKPLEETEEVPLLELAGRILAEDILSPIDVPGYDNSAMDGYALRFTDISNTQHFLLVGSSFAGRPFNGQIGAGECIRIMTGALIPQGADTVIMQENVSVEGQMISLNHPPKAGEAVRRRGEDICQGNPVLSAGRRLSPVDIGLIASVGLPTARVFRRIRVGLFSTGDELRQPGEALDTGCIYDSNRPTLLALLAQMGAQINDYGVIEDDPEAIRQTFFKADAANDVVITSGGVSVGEADFTRDILTEIGDIGFWKLAIKPGKPLAFGRLSNSYFFGLPGNPVSSVVTFHQIALPSLARLAGQNIPAKQRLSASATEAIRKRPGRTDFQRGRYQINTDGQLSVKPLPNQSSGVLSSITQANCYIVLENERNEVNAGENVTIEAFDAYLTAY